MIVTRQILLTMVCASLLGGCCYTNELEQTSDSRQPTDLWEYLEVSEARNTDECCYTGESQNNMSNSKLPTDLWEHLEDGKAANVNDCSNTGELKHRPSKPKLPTDLWEHLDSENKTGLQDADSRIFCNLTG